ncbi:MAG: hypothetical protein LUG64_02175 [Clostridiales bacterium]|nr:hypothetical protein [Clostridiales bacterium]
MEVKIKNDAGESTFSLEPEKVPELLSFAAWLASGKPTAAATSADNEKPVKPSLEEKTESVPFDDDDNVAKAAPVSDRYTSAETITPEDGYKGILLVECQHCGKRKGFCAKKRITASWCDCGKYTPLDNLVPVFLNCKCGRTFKYMTNITAQKFEYNCLACGNPVDLVLNKRQTAYVTMGEDKHE